MPADITGTDILQDDPETGRRQFVFLSGPIFAHMILADEINRTPPKTQAALLEAMQEHHVTAGGHTYRLPEPFFVLATQNPIEQEGTYPLPEAQLDRFMFNISVGYPSRAEELEIMKQTTSAYKPELKPILQAEQILRLQEIVRQVVVADHVFAYAADLVRATRPRDAGVPKFIPELVMWGAGPRASQYLILGGKARAILHGRLHVTTDDIKAVAYPVLRHRIITTFNAEAEGVTTDDIIERLITALPLPQHEAAARVRRA
jgi:MoxR-like ATPase